MIRRWISVAENCTIEQCMECRSKVILSHQGSALGMSMPELIHAETCSLFSAPEKPVPVHEITCKITPKWTHRFMDLARLVASWSKDPSTKCGAVLVHSDNTVASMGYNGFPRGVHDNPERYDNRDTKYPRIVHAEMNAILSWNRTTHGALMRLYTTKFPCTECIKAIIQSGVNIVYSPREDSVGKWAQDARVGHEMLRESEVTWIQVD